MEKLKLFHIVTNSDQQLDCEITPMLINLEHIITIKPINIMMDENLVEGFWLRMSNGKKYRATQAPEEIAGLLQGKKVKTSSQKKSNQDSVVH